MFVFGVLDRPKVFLVNRFLLVFLIHLLRPVSLCLVMEGGIFLEG